MTLLRIRAIVSVSLLTIMAVMAGGMTAARPALAASSTSATPYSYSDCYSQLDYTGEEYTVCLSGKGVYTQALTPSGVELYTLSMRSSYTVTDSSGTVIAQGSRQSNLTGVNRDDMVQVLADHVKGTFSIDDTICTYSYAVHIANGQLQFDRDNTGCLD